jgi:CheY-like chemotaxis protein
MTLAFSRDLARPLETLVLDDDYRWRYLVASTVENHLGTETQLAARGPEALDILSRRPIDVVICDLLMPGMDALQFLEQARNEFPRTKVIVLSAEFDAFPIARETLLKQGAFAAIPKTEIATTLIPLLRFLQDLPDMQMLHTEGSPTVTGLNCVN